MPQDVTTLKLSERELKKLTGINVADMNTEYIGTILAGITVGTILLVPVGFLTAFLWGLIQGSAVEFSATVKIAALIVYTPLGLWIGRGLRKSKKMKKRLDPLLKEVKNYNQLVRHIETLDQLADVGNPVQVEDRDTVLKGLYAMREQLVRALKTERILRDKPEFQSSEFSLDLTSLYALEVQQQATEYSKVLQDTLQIGESVQQELQKFVQENNA